MLATTEMKMLRRINGITLKDKQRNEDIRAELKVVNILDKVRQARLRWYGHLVQISGDNKVWKMEVEGSRPRGRPRKRWMENLRDDMEKSGLREGDAWGTTSWRKKIQMP